MPAGRNAVDAPVSIPIFDPEPTRGVRKRYSYAPQQGGPGEIGPFAIAGGVDAVGTSASYPVPSDVTISTIWIVVGSVPAGGSIEFKVRKNASTVVATYTVATVGLTIIPIGVTGAALVFLAGDRVSIEISNLVVGAYLKDVLIVLRPSFPNTVTFAANGTFTVPPGVTSIDFDLRGGEGDKGLGATQVAGRGGRVRGTYPVTPGEVFTVTVGDFGHEPAGGAPNGGNGTAGSPGGQGGGGRSEIKPVGGTIDDAIAIAAGGGGSGSGDISGGAGGHGGYPNGGDGTGGLGGSQTAGGAGLSTTGLGNGSHGQGGSGVSSTQESAASGPGWVGSPGTVGAGGGDGWYGGGGTGYGFGALGGGGGSSYVKPGVTNLVTDTGVNTGRGSVTISWEE